MKKVIIDKNELYKLYIEENKSILDVSKILGISRKVVLNRLKEYNFKKDKDSIVKLRENTKLLKYGNKTYSGQHKNKLLNILTVDKFKNKIEKLGYDKEFIFDYNNYIDRLTPIEITHKVCGRSYKQSPKYFWNRPYCLCCKEDERREKISKSLQKSNPYKEYNNKRKIKAKEKFNQYKKDFEEYTFLEEYIDSKTKIKVRHNICNHIFEVRPNHFEFKETRCPYCFRQASQSEKELYKYIESIYNGTIIRNERKQIYPMELDIYIPDKNLALEFNGTLWHSLKYKDKNYHYNKSRLCEEKGIRLIYIWEYEWKNERQRPILENIIKNALGINENRIYARKLDIEIKPSISMKDFFNKNNIQGFRPGKFAICLVDKITREPYMSYMMGHCYFGKGKYEWEVIRGATKLGYTIVGGASKIWKYFIDNYNPQNCVYYIDYNYFNGNSLSYLSLKYLKTQPGFKNYFIKTNEVKNRDPIHHKEIKELINKGLVIPIYNAGTKVYIWNRD